MVSLILILHFLVPVRVQTSSFLISSLITIWVGGWGPRLDSGPAPLASPSLGFPTALYTPKLHIEWYRMTASITKLTRCYILWFVFYYFYSMFPSLVKLSEPRILRFTVWWFKTPKVCLCVFKICYGGGINMNVPCVWSISSLFLSVFSLSINIFKSLIPGKYDSNPIVQSISHRIGEGGSLQTGPKAQKSRFSQYLYVFYDHLKSSQKTLSCDTQHQCLFLVYLLLVQISNILAKRCCTSSTENSTTIKIYQRTSTQLASLLGPIIC